MRQKTGSNFTRSAEIEATILVKALPQVSENHGETVCVAALDDNRKLVFGFYPVAFRQLEDAQKFGRWNRVRLRGRLPESQKENRAESRNVDQNSISLMGKMPDDRRAAFLEPAIVRSTKKERAEGRSLALIKPEEPAFFYRRRDAAEIAKRQAMYTRLLASPDMFAAKEIVPLTPAPYEFGYRYRDDDGQHECLCHDWEVEQTFLEIGGESPYRTAHIGTCHRDVWRPLSARGDGSRDGHALTLPRRLDDYRRYSHAPRDAADSSIEKLQLTGSVSPTPRFGDANFSQASRSNIRNLIGRYLCLDCFSIPCR